jgi:hypothetical protein
MVSARRFRDLKVGTDNTEITDLKQIEVVPRSLQAEELLVREDREAASTVLPRINGAGRLAGSAAPLG